MSHISDVLLNDPSLGLRKKAAENLMTSNIPSLIVAATHSDQRLLMYRGFGPKSLVRLKNKARELGIIWTGKKTNR